MDVGTLLFIAVERGDMHIHRDLTCDSNPLCGKDGCLLLAFSGHKGTVPPDDLANYLEKIGFEPKRGYLVIDGEIRLLTNSSCETFPCVWVKFHAKDERALKAALDGGLEKFARDLYVSLDTEFMVVHMEENHLFTLTMHLRDLGINIESYIPPWIPKKRVRKNRSRRLDAGDMGFLLRT
jgi:hypothetical protein